MASRADRTTDGLARPDGTVRSSALFSAGLTLPGAALVHAGLHLPPPWPESALLIHFEAVAAPTI